MAKKQEPTQEQIEAEVVEVMKMSRSIAKSVFGAQFTDDAVGEVYDCLMENDDAEDVEADLRRIYKQTAVIYETDAPTPKQVFDLLDRCYPNDEE